MPFDSTNYVEPLTETEQEAKDDLFRWLGRFPSRVPALLEAVRGGWMEGSSFAGPCRCVVGTLGFEDDEGTWANYVSFYPNGQRDVGGTPIELFVVNVDPGDTPSNSPVMAHLERWIVEWQADA